MGKALIIGAAATASIAGAAGAYYYVGPGHDQAIATPPILVDGPPEAALAKVRSITAARYLQAVGMNGDKLRLIGFSMAPGGAGEATATLSFDREPVLVLEAHARAVAGNRTELDITAGLPSSRFANDPNLHPYDLKVLAAMADLLATDYVSSILKGERMANEAELERAVETRIGFDQREGRAFSERVGKALKQAYGERFEEAERAADRAREDAWRTDQATQDATVDEPSPPPDNLTGSPGTDLSHYDY